MGILLVYRDIHCDSQILLILAIKISEITPPHTNHPYLTPTHTPTLPHPLPTPTHTHPTHTHTPPLPYPHPLSTPTHTHTPTHIPHPYLTPTPILPPPPHTPHIITIRMMICISASSYLLTACDIWHTVGEGLCY